jgi:hypothetical protein
LQQTSERQQLSKPLLRTHNYRGLRLGLCGLRFAAQLTEPGRPGVGKCQAERLGQLPSSGEGFVASLLRLIWITEQPPASLTPPEYDLAHAFGDTCPTGQQEADFLRAPYQRGQAIDGGYLPRRLWAPLVPEGTFQGFITFLQHIYDTFTGLL